MSSDASFVQFVVDQLAGAGSITSKKMFGEYAVYLDGKVVAFVCDNQFFVKPTDAGRRFAPDVAQAPPYPGAKNYLLIADELDNAPWLCNLVTVTARELPLPKPKKTKATPSPRAKKETR